MIFMSPFSNFEKPEGRNVLKNISDFLNFYVHLDEQFFYTGIVT